MITMNSSRQQQQPSQQQQQQPPELQRSFRVTDHLPQQQQQQHLGSSGGGTSTITRERSFVRPQSHHQNYNQMRDPNKRKSMVVTANRGNKPTMEIYRPPSVRVDGVQQQQPNGNNANNNSNKSLNVHAKEFTMAKQQQQQQNDMQSVRLIPPLRALQHSKSSGNVLQHLQHHGPLMMPAQNAPLPSLYRTIQMHQQQQQQQQQQLPHVTMPPPLHTGSLLHASPRVHFKLPSQQSTNSNNGLPASNFTPMKKHAPVNGQTFNGVDKTPQSNRTTAKVQPTQFVNSGLKRSKSLSSTDTMLASGMASLGLSAESMDLGVFAPDIQANLDKAVQDPNQLCARTLMELVGHIMRRAVESPRYALPAARHCVMIIEKEKNQTFLESLLNTCQQWYQDRDKLLNIMMGGGRPRLMAFISLLLELFCQLRRRCPQSAVSAPGSNVVPPARALLTLICKCCEECIRAPVPSASDTENLFFVLTYIGRDLETQLPGDLENLLAAVRDAFLNTAAAPSITKTLLQLIELHASHWQLPGGAVLYYYPSSK